MLLWGTAYAIGYAFPVWYDYQGYTSGLWQFCDKYEDRCSTITNPEDFHLATQILMSLGAALMLASIIANIVWMANCSPWATKNGMKTAGACAMSAGLVGAAGNLLWGLEVGLERNNYVFGWTYWVSVGGSIALFLNGAISLCNCCGEFPTNSVNAVEPITDPEDPPERTESLKSVHEDEAAPGEEMIPMSEQ
jgi:hypothetical protein